MLCAKPTPKQETWFQDSPEEAQTTCHNRVCPTRWWNQPRWPHPWLEGPQKSFQPSSRAWPDEPGMLGLVQPMKCLLWKETRSEHHLSSMHVWKSGMTTLESSPFPARVLQIYILNSQRETWENQSEGPLQTQPWQERVLAVLTLRAVSFSDTIVSGI